jgi:HD-GYP domain-containing protein (c-di-GMP phosphodiesterase class II)
MPARYLGPFGSRVAQRVFVLFLVCALVPTGVVGLFAWRRSASELERATREQLHRDSRSEGMAILSRLLVADGLLRALGEASVQLLAAKPTGATSDPMPWRSVRRAQPEELLGGPLAASERRVLEAGKSVLRSPGGERVLMIRAPDPPRGWVLVAELDGAYLWTYDRNDPDSGLTVVDDTGQLLFSSLAGQAALAVVEAAVPGLRRGGQPQPEAPIAEPWLLFLGSRFAAPTWHVIRSQSRDLTFAPLEEFLAVFRWSLLLAILVVTALSSVQIRRTLRPIQLLSQAALQLGEGRFETRVAIATRDEFGELGEAFDGMASRVERHAQALASASAVGVALSHERREERLIVLLLQALVDTTHSESAAFLRLTAGGGIEVAATQGSWRGESAAAAEAARTGEIVIRPGDSVAGNAASLALPLFDHEQRFVALLEVSGPSDESGEPIRSYRESEVAAARSLASQAAVAFNNRSLVDEFRVLFEGLIGLTVTALDEKSAYTGGHCRRVPILAEMLADAVCRTQEGAFARFEFSPAERYELRIAALLHDFGKVVTPVHVMDKATKLETIHDRIELIAVRYAVLQREAEIAWLRAKLAAAGGEAGDPPALAELEEELAFLRACNVGVEEMDPTQRDRVRAIAVTRRWRNAHGVVAPVLDDDEVENLSIPRGTLNPRERKVIEDHASLTIRLLEQLPFPPHLSGVPQIAGSHHERIDGGGYPLGLAGSQITLQGRLLGLADVFEALTAPDRPYRDPMTVSEAVEMMRGLVKEGHLDADLFEVFIRERVHLHYAMEQLRADQLDDAVFAELAALTGSVPLPRG